MAVQSEVYALVGIDRLGNVVEVRGSDGVKREPRSAGGHPYKKGDKMPNDTEATEVKQICFDLVTADDGNPPKDPCWICIPGDGCFCICPPEFC
jgi:hypothetical protein